MMKKFLVFISILFLAASLSANPGTTYYVDATGGNDDNNGTSTETPWKTVAKVNASSFSAGDSILFKRGEIWREQLTVPSSGSAGLPITFGAYGTTGANPIINGSDSISSWTQATTNVTGTVTQSNMRMSVVNGIAFTDFSAAGALTNYLGNKLTITDSTGKTLVGYIKAAGNGETYGTELITAWTNITGHTFETFTTSGSTISSAIETGSDGRARVDTLSVNGLLLMAAYNVTRNSGTTQPQLRYNANSDMAGGVDWIDYTTIGAQISYFTGTESQYFGYRTDAAIDFSATNSLKQVITPSTTGVTITSTANGATYNWTSEDTGFNRNDTTYSYSIDIAPVNVWQATVSTQPNQVFFDGTRGTLETSISNLTAPNEWYWASNVLYVYMSGDPSGHIEASQRNTAITISSKNYITVDGIDLKNANADNLRLINDSTGITIQNSAISYAYTNGIYSYTTGTSYRDTLLITINTISYNGASGILLSDYTRNSTVSHNNLHHNCLIHATDGLHEYSGGIYVGLGNTSAIVSEYNTVYSNGLTSDTNEGMGIWYDTITSGLNSIIRYNLVYSNSDVGIRFENVNQGQMYYNISYSNYEGIRVHSSSASYSNNTNLIYNNMIYNNTTYGIFIRGVNGVNNLQNNVFKNNISLGNGTSQLRATVGGDNNGTTGSGNIYTYNSFGLEATNFIEWGAGTYKSTYADWEIVYGGTTHSVETDPLMTDPANGDFTLQSTSPCINAGMNVGLTRDYVGNPVPWGNIIYPIISPIIITPIWGIITDDKVDIGAYEYNWRK
jgi:hypothetical protein